MKPWSLAVAAAILAAVALAQNSRQYTFEDATGDLKVWNIDSHLITREEDGAIAYTGRGKPLRAQFKSQGLNIETLRLVATFEPDGQKLLLDQGAFTGATVVKRTVGDQTQNLTSEKLTIKDTPDRGLITLPVSFRLNSEDVKTGQKSMLTAGSGSLNFSPFRNPSPKLQSAKILGGVKLQFTQKDGSTNLLSSAALDLLLKASDTEATINQPFEFQSQGPRKSGTQSSRMKADRGVLNLEPIDGPQSRQPLIAAVLTGSVDVRIVTEGDVIPKGKTVAEKEVSTFTAKSAKLTYRKSDGTLILSGGVDYAAEIVRDGKVFSGAKMSSDTVIVILDEDGKVKKITASGGDNPA